MPHRELKHPRQVEEWLVEWGSRLCRPGQLILIGSGALLWHGYQAGILFPLPENSMGVDPVTDSEEVAALAYECLIGSEFEQMHGWHVNLMPSAVLTEFEPDWRTRAVFKQYDKLEVMVPSVEDLLIPKLKRGEPRDKVHAQWARQNLQIKS